MADFPGSAYGLYGNPMDIPMGEEGKAVVGEPLPEGTPVADEQAVIEALRTVFDPEIPVNIYDLGLIYNIDISDKGDVDIRMTLTAPTCPVAGELPYQVAYAASNVEGTGVVSVELVWEPIWTPEKMSEEARLVLDMF